MQVLAVARPPEAPDVETRLVALARSGTPLRCALAGLAAWLVATKSWEPLGYVRPRDWTPATQTIAVGGRTGGLPSRD